MALAVVQACDEDMGSHDVVPLRSGALAVWLAGPLLTAAVAPHPSILQGEVGAVVADTGSWVALHLMAAAGIALGWWGITCVVLVHRRVLAEWAAPIFVLLTVGAFVLGSVMVLEALMFPEVARTAPQMLELDGPLLGSWTFRLVSSLGGGYLVALIALGVQLARLGVWARAGRALVVSTVAFAVFAGFFVPVLGPLSAVALAGAGAWMGLLLWRIAPAPEQSTQESPALYL